MSKVLYNNLTPEQQRSRQRENAIKCAKHFQRIGQGLIKGGSKKVNFQRMSLAEIDAWILMVTEALGIKQFNKPKF